MSATSSGSSATAMSSSVNHGIPSGANSSMSRRAWVRSTKLLSSANSMKGSGQTSRMAWISAITRSGGFTL